MKKNLLILLVIPFLFFLSCSEDFNINAPQEDVYSLNCVLRNDTTIQYAVVSVNRYTESGAPPASNSIEQNIKGAVIKIFYNDSVFVMRDTTVQILDSGIETEVNCYYIKNLLIQPGKVISIEAVVPDGHVLRSTIKVPKISFTSFITFPEYLGGYITEPLYTWNWKVDNQAAKYILNYPRLEIFYKKLEEGKYVEKKVLIPLEYSYTENNVDLKFSFNNFCFTSLETVNQVMQSISANDPNKKNYTITNAIFHVFGLDTELSKYFSAQKIFSEAFTIKLRPTDCSNIEGGKGIFGSYYKHSQTLRIDEIYVNSFGYKYDPK